MAFCELQIHSEVLGMQTTVNVIIPQRKTTGEIGIENKASQSAHRCLYLLHGFSGDQNSWVRNTSIERYAQEYGLCVVMPFAARSYYTDPEYGEKYYTYIAEELPEIIRDIFPVSSKREDTMIAGNSMGGYGALKIGMRCCDRFSAVAALSSAADVACMAKDQPKKFTPIFGKDLMVSKEDDLFSVAEMTDTNPLKPRIFMSVGTEDWLYEANQKLKAHFETLNFDYTYQESLGAHNWAYWDAAIQNALSWLCEK